MNQWTAIGIVLGYLLLLFLIASWAEKRAETGKSLSNNPYIYALSLAVFCTAWTYYGSVGRAAQNGMDFLAIYLGPTLVLPLWWIIMRKVIRICKVQRISTVADFISSRYGKSVTLGYVVTIVSVLGIIPYISIQLKAISDSFQMLMGQQLSSTASPGQHVFLNDSSFYLTCILAVFTIIYGARKVETTERHEGMVTAIAYESVFKLLAFLTAGIAITWGVFDGFTDIFSQIQSRSSDISIFTLGKNAGYSEWFAMVALSTMAIMLLPRQFQVTVVENHNENHLRKAMWLFPLYLLVINIFVLPIAAGGNLLFGSDSVNADYYVLAIPINLKMDNMALVAFLGGFSAATSMIIVSTIALSVMLSNNFIAPALLWLSSFKKEFGGKLSRIIIYSRWFSIAFILVSAYIYFKFIADFYSLVSVGLTSFAAVAQFAPALLGGIFWKKGNKNGALTGIIAGFLIWGFTLVFPSLVGAGQLPVSIMEEGLFGVWWLKPHQLFGLAELGPFSHALFWSMLFNTGLYVTFSLCTAQSSIGHNQAELFVDIFRHSTVIESATIWKGTAYLPDIRSLLTSFLGRTRTEQALGAFAAKYPNSCDEHKLADPKLVTYAEKVLAGAIGTASARIMVSSIVKEEKISMEEVVRILRESQQIISYNRELTRKSEELRQTTEELKRTYEQLKQQDELKDEFLYTVTHELRTPITSVKAFAEILYDYPELDAEEQRQFLQTIIKESERMTRLISQVLDLEKLESGAEKIAFAPLNIRDCIRDAVESLQQVLREKQIKLQESYPEELPLVNGDRDRLIQVLLNLLANAIKFCEPENGQIGIAATPGQQQIAISIEDNGRGIPEDQREVIFDKFYQARNQTRKKPVGSGLGLAISKRIVELHGGTIRARGKHAPGAVFTFSLPLAGTNHSTDSVKINPQSFENTGSR